jgi:hypothetical protein
LVHGELIRTGQVQKLTYKQLRRLEKMDRDKARDVAWIELGKELVKSAGTAIAGIGVGLGNAFNGYFSGDALAFTEKSIFGLVFFEWLLRQYPDFAKFLHLDKLGFPGIELPQYPVSTGPGTVPSSPSSPGAQPFQPGGATIAGAGGGNIVYNPGQGPQPQTAQV